MDMKKFLSLTIVLLLVMYTSASAQLFKPKEKKPVETAYQAGTVPVENKRIVFRETISLPGKSADEIMRQAKAWYSERFVKPTVISTKEIDKGSGNIFEAVVEEYIVFKKRFFVLNRARIYYYLTITSTDGACEASISRITYWHDDESPDGGMRYNAEELITDENALKDGMLKKFQGKFRTKTIDLKTTLFGELRQRLTSN